MTPLIFRPFGEFPPGTIYSLLSHSYSAWNSPDPNPINQWKDRWQEYDEDIHRYPDTVGRSGFISCLGDTVIGFGSWDPRSFPTAQIGHHCILPPFRGKGYGAIQLKRITTLLKDSRFTRVFAQTGDNEFFAPARKTYQRCGFTAVANQPPGPTLSFGLIEYELLF